MHKQETKTRSGTLVRLRCTERFGSVLESQGLRREEAGRFLQGASGLVIRCLKSNYTKIKNDLCKNEARLETPDEKHSQTLAYAYTYVLRRIHTYVPAHLRNCVPTCLHACTHAYMHKYSSFLHKYTCTHAHMCTCTCMPTGIRMHACTCIVCVFFK